MSIALRKGSVAAYDQIDALLKQLYLCTEKQQIDSLFSESKISDYKDRILLLYKCMGVEEVCSTPEKISDKDEYEFECAVFVEGTWRLLNERTVSPTS
ncbi:MAG: hypothetical protein IJ191_08770 [Treponema sp.]|nr:hypothetical protein [Treponema sp.]